MAIPAGNPVFLFNNRGGDSGGPEWQIGIDPSTQQTICTQQIPIGDRSEHEGPRCRILDDGTLFYEVAGQGATYQPAGRARSSRNYSATPFLTELLRPLIGTDYASVFYVASDVTSDNVPPNRAIAIVSVAPLTQATIQTWVIPGPADSASSQMNPLAISPAGILYYLIDNAAPDSPATLFTLKRYDLAGNAPLSDLATFTSTDPVPQEMLALRDESLLVIFTNGSVQHLDATWSLLETYTPTGEPRVLVPDRDDASFWWTDDDGFKQIDTASGSQLALVAAATLAALEPVYGVLDAAFIAQQDIPCPNLTIDKTNPGGYVPGSQSTFVLIVRSPSTFPPPDGLVIVTEIVPTGLVLLGMSGNGWTCVDNVCTRPATPTLVTTGNPLDPAYPPITVTVAVAVTAVNVTNAATLTGTGGDDDASLTLSTCKPVVITVQPHDQDVVIGWGATLSVVVIGTGPFTYQWYQGDPGDVSTPVGTNSATFATPGLANDTSYWVRISNTCGGGSTVDSLGATVYTTRRAIRRMRVGPPIHVNQRWIFHHTFQLDLDLGGGTVPATPPTLWLGWTDDGGVTWSPWVPLNTGDPTALAWLDRLGRSKSRSYRTLQTDVSPCRLIDAQLDADEGLN